MTGGDASVAVELELTYRRWLAWYPRRWRRANADALIDTLLDAAQAEGRRALRPGERANLALNGLAARVETILPRSARDLASTWAFGAGLAIVIAYFVVQDWSPWDPRKLQYSLNPFGPFASAGVLVTGLWVAAAVLLVLGRVVATRMVVLASAAVTVVILSVQASSSPEYVSMQPNPDRATFLFVIGLAVLVASGRPSRRLAVPVTALAGALGISGLLLVMHRLDRTAYPLAAGRPSWLDYFASYFWNGPVLGIESLVVSVGLVVALTLALTGHRTISATLAWSAVPWIWLLVSIGWQEVALGSYFVVVMTLVGAWTVLVAATLIVTAVTRVRGRTRIAG